MQSARRCCLRVGVARGVRRCSTPLHTVSLALVCSDKYKGCNTKLSFSLKLYLFSSVCVHVHERGQSTVQCVFVYYIVRKYTVRFRLQYTVRKYTTIRSRIIY